MRLSQFYAALERVYGSAYGRSLLADLHLPGLGCSGTQALARGDAPQRVWRELLEQTQMDPRLEWIHRADEGDIKALLGEGGAQASSPSSTRP